MSDTLAASNPYVRSAADRRREVLASVASSSAIEGIRAPFRKAAKNGKPAAKEVAPKNGKALTKGAERRAPSARSRKRKAS